MEVVAVVSMKSTKWPKMLLRPFWHSTVNNGYMCAVAAAACMTCM